MTERERRFVEAYMGQASGNGTKAAILAGYSRTTARKQASRLLTKGNILSAIEERSQRDELTWSREQRQAFWTQIAADEKMAVRDRLKASELLARSQGDFIEKRLLQVEGNGHVSLAELIAGAAPADPVRRPPPSAWEAPRDPVAHPPSAVAGPTPSTRELPVAPDNGRHQWGAQRTPASDGPAGTVDIKWDPYSP